DEAYSAFATAGMKRTAEGKIEPQELKDLAKLNVESLNEFGYFTFLKQGSKQIDVADPKDGYFLEEDGKSLVLNFELPLKTAVVPASNLNLRVDDETFFVAFSFDEKDPVTIQGKTACKVDVKRPAKTVDQSGMAKLGEDFFSNLKTGFTDQYATTVKLQCP
ncbi:MAG: DUF1007 family protein, partial [Albidovulum sp.]